MRRNDDIFVRELGARLDSDDITGFESVVHADGPSMMVDVSLKTEAFESVDKKILHGKRGWRSTVADILLHPVDIVVQIHRVNLIDHRDDVRILTIHVRIGLVAAAFVVDQLGLHGGCAEQKGHN